MGFIYPTEQDIYFIESSNGLVSVPAGSEGVLCSHRNSFNSRGRIRYIEFAPEVSADWSTSEFYLKINGVKSIPQFRSIQIPSYPLGNSKELIIDTPQGAVIELCVFNSAGIAKNYQGSFEGWEYSII